MILWWRGAMDFNILKQKIPEKKKHTKNLVI